MLKIMPALSLILISSTVFADQKATLTCKGNDVILLERSPYLGESSKFSQSLFVLKSIQNDSETRDTAFFLNVFEEAAAGTTILTGNNEVGGSFQLEYKRMQEVGDGTVIKMEASGTITYSHGKTLTGKNVPVKCTLQ